MKKLIPSSPSFNLSDFFKFNIVKKIQKAKQIFFFPNGRSALFYLMKDLNKHEKTSLIVPAFMCSSTIDPLIYNKFEITEKFSHQSLY